MTSEIRVNKLQNRVGLGTVEYTNTGIVVSGIVTCTELSGLTALNIAGVGTANTLDINGDIDVDGHTNLDNVSVAGVSTFSGDVNVGGATITNPSGNALDFSGSITASDVVTAGALLHEGDPDTKIAFGNNEIDFQAADSSRLKVTQYGTYVQAGHALAFLSTSGPTPNIKSGGTNNQDLLFTTGTGNPTRMQITSGGSVLIDTTVTTEVSGDFDDLVIGSTSDTNKGISIVGSTTGGVGSLTFTDGASYKNQGLVQYRHADDSMRFHTAQYERLRITSAGAVGIATATPINDFTILTDGNGYFDIHGSGGYGAEFNVYHKDTKANTYKFANNGGGNELAQHYIMSTAGKYLWYIGGTATSNEKMRLHNNGHLGIGTANPLTHVDIYATPIDTATLDTTNCKNLGLWVRARTPSNTTGNIYTGITLGEGRTGLYAYDDGGGAAHGMGFWTGSNSGVSEKLRITSDGKIGINQGTPTADLEVCPTGTSTSSTIFIHAPTHNTNVASEAILKFGYGHSGSPDGVGHIKMVEEAGNSFDADFIFGLPTNNGSGGSTTNERLRITSDGKIGINQTPTRELSLHSPDNNNALIHFTNDDTGETSSDGILVGLNGNEDMIINNQESGKNIIVYTHNGSSVGERLRITSTGLIYVNGDGTGGRIDATAGDASMTLSDGNGRQTFKIATMASGQSAAHGFNADGNLAINKTSGISAKLHIGDSSNNGALSQLIKLGNDSSGAGTGAQINMGAGHANESTSACIAGLYDGTGTAFIVKTAGTYANQSTVGERLRIKSDGETNIGTGAVNIAKFCQSGNKHQIVGQAADNVAALDVYSQHGSSAAKISFAVSDNRTGSKSNAFVVKGNGHVGINTDNPSKLLTIHGGDLAVDEGRFYLSSDSDAAVPGASFGYQVISGKKVFSASNTYVGLAYVGHSHSIMIQYMCVEGGNTALGGSHGEIYFHTTYGSSQQGISQQAYTNAMNGGRITSGVSFTYTNTGAGSHGNNYVLRAKVSYSGSTHNFALHYTIKGISSGNMYV